MYSKSRMSWLVVLVTLIAGLIVGVGPASAEGFLPVEGGECRRSDCPVGAVWGNCRWVELPEGPVVWICDCICVPPDVVLAPAGIGSVRSSRPAESYPGMARVGFWGGDENLGWLSFRLTYLPEREVKVGTVVLEDVSTQWATDENASLVVELIDLGSPPGNYWELSWPVPVTELLRLTTGEIWEMTNYYEEPINLPIPPALLEERIARARQNPDRRLIIRLRMEGATTNSLLDVGDAKLYIKWAD